MKIFNREQIYKADEISISKQQIDSYTLMERAGGMVAEWLQEHIEKHHKIHVFCGIGNNGGDGLVIARRLLEMARKVNIYVVNYSEKRSGDFLKAQKELEQTEGGEITLLEESSALPGIEANAVIVDAVFGIGYNRPAAGWVQEIFKAINNSKARSISVDVPSGLYMDAEPETDEFPVKADVVLTFQVPKLIFFLPKTGQFIKKWEVLDIGLDKDFINENETDKEVLHFAEIRKYYKNRKKYTHKGTYGHSLIIGGSYGKVGAAILSSKACLKSGSGLVTAYIPQFAMPIMQSALPEVMVLTDRHRGHQLEEIAIDLKPDVIGLGMGMGTAPITIEALQNFLKKNETPLVVDADGLNCIAKRPELIELLPKKSVLTPHPKELERLIGSWKDDFEKLEKAKKFASKHDLILVIKGANTITIYDEKLYINDNGNPGMATGGTGDALTGIITGLIAQNYEALEAAIFGVYLHGSAGDHAAKALGYEAMTAGDLVEYIGKAYQDFYEE